MTRALSVNSLSTILGRQHALKRARTQLELHQDEGALPMGLFRLPCGEGMHIIVIPAEREFDGSEASLPDAFKDRSALETFLIRLPYYVPIFKWLPEYNWTLFGYDLV